MKRLCLFINIFLSLQVTTALCDEKTFLRKTTPIVVNAPKDLPLVNAPYTIHKKELEKYQEITTALTTVPSLSISRNGGPGQLAVAQVRGLSGRNTLVVLDGIPLRVLSGGFFDLSIFPTQSFSEVMVWPGTSGFSLGAPAIGGVIELKTAQNKANQNGSLTFEKGTDNTTNSHLQAGFTTSTIDAVFHATTNRTSGILSTQNLRKLGEELPYENQSISGGVNYTPTTNFELGLIFRNIDARGRYDTTFLPPLPPKPYGKNKSDLQLYVLTNKIRIQPNIISSFHLGIFEYAQKFTPFLYESQTSGTSLRENLSIKWSSSQETLLTISFSQNKLSLSGGFNQKMDENLFALHHKYFLMENFWMQGEVGLAHHQNFSSRGIQGYGLYMDISKTLHFFLKYKSGIQFPTLYEFSFENQFIKPNPGLKPEKSRSQEIGFAHKKEKVQIQVILYASQSKNMIYGARGGAFWTNYNLKGMQRVSGIEGQATWALSKKFQVSQSITGLSLSKINRQNSPSRYKSFTSIDYKPSEEFLLNYTFSNVGKHYSMGYKLKGYSLHNLYMSLEITKNLRLYGKLDNMFNEKYQEVYPYATRGRFFYVGITSTF